MLCPETSELTQRLDGTLRPLGITRNMKAYRILCECLQLVLEREDRLESVQREIYEPLAQQHHSSWTAIQSALRRAAHCAWDTNPGYLQELAGYPLDGCPSAVQFLEALYNAVARS